MARTKTNKQNNRRRTKKLLKGGDEEFGFTHNNNKDVRLDEAIVEYLKSIYDMTKDNNVNKIIVRLISQKKTTPNTTQILDYDCKDINLLRDFIVNIYNRLINSEQLDKTLDETLEKKLNRKHKRLKDKVSTEKYATYKDDISELCYKVLAFKIYTDYLNSKIVTIAWYKCYYEKNSNDDLLYITLNMINELIISKIMDILIELSLIDSAQKRELVLLYSNKSLNVEKYKSLTQLLEKEDISKQQSSSNMYSTVKGPIAEPTTVENSSPATVENPRKNHTKLSLTNSNQGSTELQNVPGNKSKSQTSQQTQLIPHEHHTTLREKRLQSGNANNNTDDREENSQLTEHQTNYKPVNSKRRPMQMSKSSTEQLLQSMKRVINNKYGNAPETPAKIITNVGNNWNTSEIEGGKRGKNNYKRTRKLKGKNRKTNTLKQSHKK